MTHRIYVDAGHGGHDPGAVDGKRNDALLTEEEDIALDLALRYGQAMTRCGATVRQSRTSDVFPTLQERTAAANSWPATLFVSWHCNAHFDGSPAKGIEILHFPGSQNAIALANAAHNAMDDVSPWGDRGLKPRGDLHVLRATRMPAILIEAGFLTDAEEERHLNNPAYRLALAEAAARGTCQHLGLEYRVTAPPAPARPPARPTVAPRPSLARPRPIVRFGMMANQHVRVLQKALNRRGASPILEVDGHFGRNTRREVRKFQQRNGLTVDGVVGPQTWGALGH